MYQVLSSNPSKTQSLSKMLNIKLLTGLWQFKLLRQVFFLHEFTLIDGNIFDEKMSIDGDAKYGN